MTNRNIICALSVTGLLLAGCASQQPAAETAAPPQAAAASTAPAKAPEAAPPAPKEAAPAAETPSAPTAEAAPAPKPATEPAAASAAEKAPAQAAPVKKAEAAHAPAKDAEVEAALATNEMPALAKQLGCVACHAIDHKVVGPAWKDVGKRYSDATTFEYKGMRYPLVEGLIMKVSQGGAGHWGPTPMIANDPTGAKRDKIEHLVRFVLKLGKQ